MRTGSKIQKQMLEYTLTDYEFLEDYEIIQSLKSDKSTFLAQIKNSQQKVRFIKKKFTYDIFQRFKALCKLYKNGIVLADNMFIIEQCQSYYFYVIEAELEVSNNRFRNLQQYLFQSAASQQQRKGIVSKIKILVDCLHQEGQPYAGLDVRNIIVDDQNHIYLAPFQLEPQLKTDHFSRAYYPPEILSKIQAGQSQIDELSMIRWDYWSFGCITAEILLYSSPLFLVTSLAKQIRRIKQFMLVDQLTDLDEPMKNVIANSLNEDQSDRSISTTQIIRSKNAQIESDLKKTVKNFKKTYQKVKNDDVTELNIYKDSQTGDSQLSLHLISLQGMAFKDQLHITIHLNKKYHFYVDFISQKNRYKLNRTITIRNNFKQIEKMLEEPVKIQTKQGSNKATIFLNLQSLVIMHEGRRLWNKQLLGTYKADKESSCPHAKIKITCVLNSPQFFIEQQKLVQKTKEKNIPDQTKPHIQKVLTEVTNTLPVPKKKKQKQQSKFQIPSISQISKSISSITEHFIKKLSSNDPSELIQDPFNQKTDQIQLS